MADSRHNADVNVIDLMDSINFNLKAIRTLRHHGHWGQRSDQYRISLMNDII
jgi:hypothetical protein